MKEILNEILKILHELNRQIHRGGVNFLERKELTERINALINQLNEQP